MGTDQHWMKWGEQRRTCWSLRLVPSSAIRWCLTQSFRGGGWGEESGACISGTLLGCTVAGRELWRTTWSCGDGDLFG